MAKKSLSSLELAALVQEMQALVKGTVSQIYHLEDKEMLFQFHVTNKGKQYVKIIPGKLICLTSKKETASNPTSFCLQLRKYLDHAFVKSIFQKESERIVIFELEKKEKYFLIIELFSKGNIIFTNGEYDILGVLEQQEWKDRSVRVGKKYLFPKPAVDWKSLTEKELLTLLNKSEKRSLVTALATDVGLGGLYSEELCRQAQLDKEMLPKEINAKEAKLLTKCLAEYLQLIANPKGYVYAEEVTPLPLLDRSPIQITETYSEAIDILNPLLIISPYAKRINSLKHMIGEQEEAIVSLEQKAELNKRKGELIYERYLPLQKMLEIVKEMRKTKDWKAVAEELKKEKKIKKIDLKEKKIILDL